MSFAKVRKARKRRVSGLALTIYKDGLARLTPEASESLGQPERVALFVDREARRLGIGAAAPDDPDAYSVQAPTSRHGSTIRLRSVLSDFGLEHPFTLTTLWGAPDVGPEGHLLSFDVPPVELMT